MPNQGKGIAQYFVDGAFLGSREQYCCGYRGESGEPLSAYWPHTAYFCPVCGEVWGREVMTYEFDYDPLPVHAWVVETRRCAKHGDGSLLVGKSPEGCSKEVLVREFQLLDR